MSVIAAAIDETELEGDHGHTVESLQATCSKCGHTTESFGTSEASIRRCLVLLREECPREERNYYTEGRQ